MLATWDIHVGEPRSSQAPGQMSMMYRKIGICLKSDQPQLGGMVEKLEKWLGERGHTVLFGNQFAEASQGKGLQLPELAEKVDLIVVLGGDGTLLAVARASGSARVPILGVNLGTLGFLTEISQEELFETLEEMRAGRLVSEERMRLDVTLERDGEIAGRYLALNDAVIARTALSRMVDLETRADGADVTTYHGDGLIVSTPTGSSAYSLSAGGPLVLPGFEAVLLTPICPHTLGQRPLVLPAECDVEIRAQDTRGGDVQLTVDGQVGCEVREGDCVRVRRSEHPLHLLVRPDRNHFEVMRRKLRWGTR